MAAQSEPVNSCDFLAASSPEQPGDHDQTKRKLSKIVHEDKRGALKSGNRRNVRNQKQAIAIAISESGHSGKRKKTERSQKSH
jgi:hypothetical protein